MKYLVLQDFIEQFLAISARVSRAILALLYQIKSGLVSVMVGSN